jgi:glucarate dehydratase
LDILGKKLGVPVYQLLGGKLRDEVEFASYIFFCYPNEQTGEVELDRDKLSTQNCIKELGGYPYDRDLHREG